MTIKTGDLRKFPCVVCANVTGRKVFMGYAMHKDALYCPECGYQLDRATIRLIDGGHEETARLEIENARSAIRHRQRLLGFPVLEEEPLQGEEIDVFEEL